MFNNLLSRGEAKALAIPVMHARIKNSGLTVLIVVLSLLVVLGILRDESNSPTADAAPYSESDWGTYLRYNAFIFGEMDIQDGGRVGGAIATGGNINLPNPNPFSLGYDLGTAGPTTFNGDTSFSPYDNPIVPGDPPQFQYPTLVTGATNIDTDGNDQNWDHVYNGNLVSTDSFKSLNDSLFGFQLSGDGLFQSATQASIDSWVDQQRERANYASQTYLQAGDDASHRISFSEYSSGSYVTGGADRFRNTSLTVDGQVYENVLLITVESEEDISPPSWWPTEEFFHINVPWVEQYDLVIYSFPDVQNVVAQSGAFLYEGGTLGAQVGLPWNGLSASQQEERIALGSKLILNFPNAQNITFQPDIFHGSILAPQADARFDGGVLIGSLVVDNYTSTQAHTLYPVQLTDLALDIVENGIGSIEIAKFLRFNGQDLGVHLSDAQFILVSKDGATEQYFNGSGSFVDSLADAAIYIIPPSGEISIEEVPPGEYWLRETFTPEAFAPPSEDVQVLVVSGEVARVEIFNEPLVRDVAFTKVDIDTGLPLEGAIFDLYRESDDFYGGVWFVGTFTSAADGSLLAPGLPVGTYTAVEVEPPTGFELVAERLEFQILVEGGLLVVRDEAGQPFASDPIIIGNIQGIPDNRVIISKIHTDAEGVVRVLPDAQFSLHQFIEGTGVWDLVPIGVITNDLGYFNIDGLPLGTYRLVEMQAPPGFLLSNPNIDADFPDGFAREFEVEAGDSEIMVDIENEILTTDIELWKVGPDINSWLPDPNAAPIVDLAGASFRLEKQVDDGGSTWAELVESIETGVDGRAFLTDLSYGNYRLTEFESPLGYHLDGPLTIYFELSFDTNEEPVIVATYDGNAVTETTFPISTPDNVAQPLIRIANVALVHDLWIAKRSDENPLSYLPGAVFQIQRSQGDSAGPWVDYGGEITSNYLEVGGVPVLDENGIEVAAAHFPLDPGLVGGRYRVVEVASPPGYETQSHELVTLDGGREGFLLFSFSIEGRTVVPGGGIPGEVSAFGGSIYFNAVNYAIAPSASLRITKTELDESQVLAGAQFMLFNDQGWMHIAYTNEEGAVDFEDLEEGSYLLAETFPPSGFPRVDDWMWTVEVDPQATSPAPLVPARIIVEPDPGHLGTPIARYTGIGDDDFENFAIPNTLAVFDASFRKVDAEQSSLFLEGAQFSLYDEGDTQYTNPLQTVTSNAQGLVTLVDLLPGTYALLENNPPSGYDAVQGSWLLTLESETGAVSISPQGAAPAFIPTSDDAEVTLYLPNVRSSIPPTPVTPNPVPASAAYSLPVVGSNLPDLTTGGALLLSLTSGIAMVVALRIRSKRTRMTY